MNYDKPNKNKGATDLLEKHKEEIEKSLFILQNDLLFFDCLYAAACVQRARHELNGCFYKAINHHK